MNAQPIKPEDAGQVDVSSLRWRGIGPYRGGRSVAVCGDYHDPNTYYMGACGGGVWKTTDGGANWQNVSDGYFGTGSVGAIAVSPHDSRVVYAGMGECSLRGDVSHGDGVYKSTDAGRTWRRVGLEDSQQVARIIIHPKLPQTVFVAVLGRLTGPSEERGVFRSDDGGESWRRVLFVDASSGAVDLEMDADSPDTLYAATWEVRRRPWGLRHGGAGSKVFKSTDRGESWVELSGKGGLPGGQAERIALACSAKGGRLWALVSAESERGVYLSDNAGRNWRKVNDHPDLFVRPYYFNHMKADPVDPDTVYFLNFRLWKSTNAGASFEQVSAFHPDHHDMWIDPRNNQRMIDGSDGGALISVNGGHTWTETYNQPTAQIYSVAVDDQYPFNVCGPQQDWSTVIIPSREWMGEYNRPIWHDTQLSEAGFMAFDKGDNGVYIGDHHWLHYYDRRTKATRHIAPWDEIQYGWGTRDIPLRFNWAFPVVRSPHDGSLLIGSQRVHQTHDRGKSWQAISPDLTRALPRTLEATPGDQTAGADDSGYWGPITRDSNGDAWYATLTAIEPSPVERGVVWAGSDDGRISVTRDGGAQWRDATPPQLPVLDEVGEQYGYVSSLCASRHSPGAAYAAVHRYRAGDLSPWLFATSDYGANWRRIDAGLPRDSFTRVLLEDPKAAGLLYCGAETGAHVSLDNGASWRPFGKDLPVVPVHDLAVKRDSLVAATHGRGFWVFDDLYVLRRIAANDRSNRDAIQLFVPGSSPAPLGSLATPGREDAFVAHYWLPSKAPGVRVTIHDKQGDLIRTLLDSTEPADRSPGLHSVAWDFKQTGEATVPGAILRARTGIGPTALPGSYQVVLRCGGETAKATFAVEQDPRSNATPEDLQQKFSFQQQARDKTTLVNQTIIETRELRATLQLRREALAKAATTEYDAAAAPLLSAIQQTQDALIQHQAITSKDLLALPVKLNNKLYTLANRVEESDAAPTAAQWELFKELSQRADNVVSRYQAAKANALPRVNALLTGLGHPPIDPTVP